MSFTNPRRTTSSRPELLSIAAGGREGDAPTITCSLCLRVLRGSEWIESERVIKEIRSDGLEAPLRLRPRLRTCCEAAICTRGTGADEDIAA